MIVTLIKVKKGKLSFQEKTLRSVVRGITANRISSGEIQVKPCRVCGSTFVEAHHWDYRTYKVIFLCAKHHVEWHNRQRYFEHLNTAYGMKFVRRPKPFRFKWVWVKNHMDYRPRPSETMPSVIRRGQKLIKVI